ncbi:MAG: hypothetical protein JWO46_2765, partial [Nocardioidaceae bacterium]|nr:hypothetical protein [Nocardioidaceae bacterium]
MRFSDLKGKKAVSTHTADTVGKVSGFLLDPATRTVAALSFKKTGGGKYAAWSDLTGVGVDAVTMPDTTAIVESGPAVDALTGKEHAVLKKRVLSTAGDDLGKVKDIDFDADTGELRYLLVDKTEIAGSRLRGVGSYAVVVD